MNTVTECRISDQEERERLYSKREKKHWKTKYKMKRNGQEGILNGCGNLNAESKNKNQTFVLLPIFLLPLLPTDGHLVMVLISLNKKYEKLR
jgi:hypothetical protein